MNIFKLMQAMRPYIQRGDMTYDLAVKYLKERGVQFDGIVKKALDNMFKKIKARDPVFDKSVTKMPIDDAGTPFNPNTLKSTTEKRGVENLFQETKKVNIPADKLNHQMIADQAGIEVELIKGKDWVEILEVLKGLKKADGGRVDLYRGGSPGDTHNNPSRGGFDYESEAYGAPDTIASITRHSGGGGDSGGGGGGGANLNLSPVVTYTPSNQIEKVGLQGNLGKLMAAGVIDLEDALTTGNIDPTTAAALNLGNFNLSGIKSPDQEGIFAQGNIGPVNVGGSYQDFGDSGIAKNIGASGMLGNLGMGVNYDFESNPNLGLSYNNPDAGLKGGVTYNLGGKPEGIISFSKKFKKGGRVGYNLGGNIKKKVPYDARASMQDYASALKNVSGGRTYQQLDDLKAYARNLAAGQLREARFDKSPRGLGELYDKYFKGKSLHGGQAFNWGRTTDTMNQAHSYNLKDKGQILDDMAHQIMADQQSYEVQKLNQQRIAEREAAKQRAEQERINAAIKAAYGSPEDYEFQARLLGGMNPEAYYDYLVTGDPQNVTGQGIGDWHTPYNVWYEQQLRQDQQMGLPTSEQIQYGQVPSGPGGLPMLPTGGQIPSRYSSYADAVATQKQEWDRQFPQGSPKYQSYKSTYAAPDPSTWNPYLKWSGSREYKQGGRVGYDIGGLTGQAKNIYDSWISAGHSSQDALDYLSSRGMYNAGSGGIESIVNTQQSIIPQSGGGGNETWDPNTAQTKMFNKDVWTEISPGLYDWVNTEIEGFLSPTGWKTAQGKNIQHAGLYGIRPMFSYLFDRGAPYNPGGKYRPGSIKGAWQEREDRIKLEQAAEEQQRQETARQIAAAAQAFQSTGDYDEFSGAGGNVDPGGPASRMDWSALTDDEGDKYATGGVATMFTRRR